MRTLYFTLIIIHIVLVFAIGIWLLALGRSEPKKIPRGFLPLTLFTMVLSLAMMQINLMQHNADSAVELLSPYKYGVKTLAFAVIIAIAFKYYKKPFISKRTWQAMIGLMAFDLIITGVWM